MNRQVKADMVLASVTLFWGVSYLLVDIALTETEPFTLNFIRFFGAFVIAATAFFPRIKNVSKTTLAYSALIGLILVFVYIGSTFGIMYTSLSNAGFLCALSCVFTPVFGFIFKKQKPGRKFIFVIVICFAGIALLSLDGNLKPAPGDIICLLCAVLFLAVFCTGTAFVAQTVAQQYTSASRAGVIFTLEPVFAAITAYFFAGERLIPRAYAGAALLLISLLIMEADLNRITKKLFRKRIE